MPNKKQENIRKILKIWQKKNHKNYKKNVLAPIPKSDLGLGYRCRNLVWVVHYYSSSGQAYQLLIPYFLFHLQQKRGEAKLSLATYVALESKSIYIHYRGFSQQQQQHYILARPTIYKDSAGTGKKRGPSFCTTVLTPKERLLRLETQGMQLQI